MQKKEKKERKVLAQRAQERGRQDRKEEEEANLEAGGERVASFGDEVSKAVNGRSHGPIPSSSFVCSCVSDSVS